MPIATECGTILFQAESQVLALFHIQFGQRFLGIPFSLSFEIVSRVLAVVVVRLDIVVITIRLSDINNVKETLGRGLGNWSDRLGMGICQS